MIDLDYLKSRINPAYANTIGTESYERRECVEEIEWLRTLLREWLEFSSDVVPGCPAGADWLDALRNKTESATRERSA